jgi:hypothetical protein
VITSDLALALSHHHNEDNTFARRLPSIYDEKITFESDVVDISYDKPGYLLPWKGDGDTSRPPKTACRCLSLVNSYLTDGCLASAFTINLVPKLVWNKDYNGEYLTGTCLGEIKKHICDRTFWNRCIGFRCPPALV